MNGSVYTEPLTTFQHSCECWNVVKKIFNVGHRVYIILKSAGRLLAHQNFLRNFDLGKPEKMQ